MRAKIDATSSRLYVIQTNHKMGRTVASGFAARDTNMAIAIVNLCYMYISPFGYIITPVGGPEAT